MEMLLPKGAGLASEAANAPDAETDTGYAPAMSEFKKTFTGWLPP